MRLSHRAILGDITRLAALLDAPGTGADAVSGVAPGLAPAPAFSPSWARAVSVYVHQFNAAVRHHHHNEDDLLWPVIEAATAEAATAPAGVAAAEAVDLAPYLDEHGALDRLQDACDLAAARFAADPVPRTAHALAVLLAEQRGLLVAHIGAEERELFPVITRYVGADRYARTEAAIRRSTPPELGPWLRAWLTRFATEDERRRLLPPTAARPGPCEYTALEAEVFGPAGTPRPVHAN
jgi:hemerythrin-like domain-containing protein